MNAAETINQYASLFGIVNKLQEDLNSKSDFVLLYAYNGTGKTRLSMEFKESGKGGEFGEVQRDTLYFNAYTEDLFSWDNDLENDAERVMKLNSGSNFFGGFKKLALEEKIFAYLERYVDFDFKIDYETWKISFKKGDQDNIKISRGEENIFIWCIFLAIAQLAIEGEETYNWVKYIYVDDPISSLDENNAISVATDLSQLLRKAEGKVKTVVSSHHILFFNVMCNELRGVPHKRYFLHKNGTDGFTLRGTDDTPFYHHVATLSELQEAAATGHIKTYHFNSLRSILEKTSSFFGYNEFKKCIHGVEDAVLFDRALNLLSHGKHSVYAPVEMTEDNKKLFKDILKAFLKEYSFELPKILSSTAPAEEPAKPEEA